MATAADKAEYDQRISQIKKKNDRLSKQIAEFKKSLLKLPPENLKEIYKIKLNLISEIIQNTFNQLIMSRISNETLHIKNENVLTAARKNLYLILQYFEEMVGKSIDEPISEQREEAKIFHSIITNLEKFEILKRVGFLLIKLENLYGDSSKWKWSFVEMEGRLIRAFKNLIDFQELFKNLDPSVKGYAERMDLLNLILKSLDEVAERYRSKYELTAKRIEDMNHAVSFLAFKRRVCILLGDNDSAEYAKKKFDSWKKKLNEDMEGGKSN